MRTVLELPASPEKKRAVLGGHLPLWTLEQELEEKNILCSEGGTMDYVGVGQDV